MSLPVFRAVPLPAPGPYRLDGDAGRHAQTVRRMRRGERLLLVDGAGGRAEATVTAAVAGALDLDVTAVVAEPPPAPRLTVVQALAKGDRGELAVELLTEVGVDEVVPWAAARSVVRWDADRAARGRDRWQRVADAAAEQSRRSWWPQVAARADTAGVLARVAAADLALVLHEEAHDPLAGVAVPTGGEVLLVVGPEGGLEAGERSALVAAGAREVRLGREVLRTSSAGLAAAAVVLAAGRWTAASDRRSAAAGTGTGGGRDSSG